MVLAALKRTWSAVCAGIDAARDSWNSAEKTIRDSTDSTTEPIVDKQHCPNNKRRKIDKVSSSSSPPQIHLNVGESTAVIDNDTNSDNSGSNTANNLLTVAADQEQNNFGKVSPLLSLPPSSNNDTSKEDNESDAETDTTSEETLDFGDSINDVDNWPQDNSSTVTVNVNAVEKELASFIMSDHVNKLTKKSPLREGEYDIVIKKINNKLGIRIFQHRESIFTRLERVDQEHLILGNPTVESDPESFFITAIQGMNVVYVNHGSKLEMIKGIDSQQIAIRLQYRLNFHVRFQHSLLNTKQRNKKYTAGGISTLFRCEYDSPRDSRVITLDGNAISALMAGASFSDVAITEEATNPIALGSNDCSTVASIKDIPVALLTLSHLKLLLANEGLSKATLKEMKNCSSAIQYIVDNASGKMITTEDSITHIEKVPRFLAILGTSLLSGCYSNSIDISMKGVISVDTESFGVVLKQVCGSTYDITQFTKDMGQYGFRTASVNEDRIPIITKPSQVVYIHDRVWTDNLSDILLLKKVVRVRSASPTSTLINIDQEGEDTSNVCVLDEAGSDWSIDDLRKLYQMKHQNMSWKSIASNLKRSEAACRSTWYNGKPNDNEDFTEDEFIGMCKIYRRIARRAKEFDIKLSDYWAEHSKRKFLHTLLKSLPPGMTLVDFVNGSLHLCHINAHKLWNNKDPNHGHMSLHPSNFALWLADTNTVMGELTHLSRVFVNHVIGFVNDPDGQHWEHGLLQSYFPDTAREQLRIAHEKKKHADMPDDVADYNLYESVTSGPKLEYDGTTVLERNEWMHNWIVLRKDPSLHTNLEMVELPSGNYALRFKS